MNTPYNPVPVYNRKLARNMIRNHIMVIKGRHKVNKALRYFWNERKK